MMKLIQAQKAAKTNIFPDYWTLLYGRRLSDIMIKSLTGTLPLTFRTSETALRSWEVYGNDFQHEESTGTRLPMSFYTDEDKLRDWTIYGNNTQHNYSAEGTLPLTFTSHTAGAASNWEIEGNDEPGTENLFNKNAKDTDNGYVNNTYLTADGGMTGSATVWYISEYIPINSMSYYTLVNVTGNSPSLCWYDITKTYISGFKYNNQSTITAQAPANAAFCRVTIKQSSGPNEDIFMLVEGSTVPITYIPYQQGVGQRTKNLLEITATSTTISGVTFTVDKTAGTIIANGTANSTVYLHLPINALSGDYYYSGCALGGSPSTYELYAWDNTISSRPKKWDGETNVDSDYGGTSQEIKVDREHSMLINIRIYSGYTCNNLVFKPMLRKADTSAVFIPFGYEIPLSVSQTGQTTKNYDIYIGDSPLTAGQSISKTSTGVDIDAIAGSNTITTDLYNKPSMSIEGVDYVGVGEYVNGQWQIPLTVTHYTDNIFDKDAKNTNKGYEDSTCIMWAGSIPYPYMTGNEDNNYFVSEKIPCSPNTTYYLTDGIFKNTDNGIYSVFLWNRYRMSDYQAFPTEKTFTTGDDTKFIQLCVLKAYADTVMITTQPTETYIPHVEVNNVNVPIDAPLTASDTATKTSTGVDIPAYVGTNTISTTLENKPEMRVDYGYKGVGEHSGDTWKFDFITSANGNQQLTKITMDKPLRAGETLTSEQAGVTIPTYADAENTLSLYPNAAGYGNPEMTITYKGG